MKAVLIIFGIIGVVAIGVLFWRMVSSDLITEPDTTIVAVFPDSSPNTIGDKDQPLPNQRASSGTHPSIEQAFREQTKQTGPFDVTLGGTVIVSTYALQAWGNEYSGGEALFTYSSDKGWILTTLGGGMPSVPSLVTIGIPKDIAEYLIAGL